MNEHVDDLIDLYALGALEPDEQVTVDEHLDRCTRCRLQLEEAKRVVLLMAWTPDQHDPPPALQHKVMNRIAQLQRAQSRAPEPWWRKLDPQRWWSIPRPVLGLATACALALVLILGGRNIQLQQQLSTTQAELVSQREALAAAEAQLAVQQPVATLLREPGTRLVALINPSNTDDVQGYLLLRPDAREAVVTTAALAPLPEGKTYQFWLIGEGQPESGGVFGLNQQGIATLQIEAQRPLGEYTTIGISVEPTGGSDQPTDVVLLTDI